MNLYNSFLIRYWLRSEPRPGERAVVTIEHIQTGQSARVASLAEAQAWIGAACQPTPAQPQEIGTVRPDTNND